MIFSTLLLSLLLINQIKKSHTSNNIPMTVVVKESAQMIKGFRAGRHEKGHKSEIRLSSQHDGGNVNQKRSNLGSVCTLTCEAAP